MEILCVGNDITERKLAVETLRESEERFRRFAEEASFEGIILHHEGMIVDANQTFAAMFGYSRHELIGMEPLRLVAPESRDLALTHLQEEYESTYELMGLRKDGSTFPVDVHAKSIPYHGKTVRVAAVRDITERKKIGEELQSAHQKLMDIIEFLPDPTLVVDQQGKVTAWNRAMEEITSLKKEDILGRGDHAYAVPLYGHPRPMLVDIVANRDDEAEKLYECIKRKGNTLYAEVYVPGINSGKGGYIWATASPLSDRHGNLIGAIESIREITERKETESTLQQREKDLEKKSLELEETNTALRVLLKHREEDQPGLP